MREHTTRPHSHPTDNCSFGAHGRVKEYPLEQFRKLALLRALPGHCSDGGRELGWQPKFEPVLTLKRLWGFARVRYRGLAKNANRAFAMLAMLNVSKWGRLLTGHVRPV